MMLIAEVGSFIFAFGSWSFLAKSDLDSGLFGSMSARHDAVELGMIRNADEVVGGSFLNRLAGGG